MDEQLVTPDDIATYATVADLGYVNGRVDALEVTVAEDRERFAYDRVRINDAFEVLNNTVSALEYRPRYYREIDRMSEEISQIKEALVDIQDSLRRLGMDDMSKRLGDLNLLMT